MRSCRHIAPSPLPTMQPHVLSRWAMYFAYRAVAMGDPCLNISKMHGRHDVRPPEYTFDVTLLSSGNCSTAPPEKAAALATFLTLQRNYGGTVLKCRFLNASGIVIRPQQPPTPWQVLLTGWTFRPCMAGVGP
jgi:hypothetical protein